MGEQNSSITQLIRGMEDSVTDLFLTPGKVPHGRIAGKVTPLAGERIAEEGIRKFLEELLLPKQKEFLLREQEITVLYLPDAQRRYRINIFFVHQRPALVVRQVKQAAKTFEELHLPGDLLSKLCMKRSGLILLVGATGTGKSTTAASVLHHIARQGGVHIITVEDPIEFLIEDEKSIVHQRQVGTDVISYQDAMKHFMFQSPDVIFIGDIKDTDLMATALHAAESGPLVIANMHAANVPRTIEKILGFFPRAQHEGLLMQLSSILKGIFSLRLVPTPNPKIRLPAYEAMVLTPTIIRLLREGSIHKLKQSMEEGASYYGSRTFEQSLADMVLRKQILLEDAKIFADNPDELQLYVKGMKKLQLEPAPEVERL